MIALASSIQKPVFVGPLAPWILKYFATGVEKQIKALPSHVDFREWNEWKQVLAQWQQHETATRLKPADHAAAMFTLGRLVRGRFAGSDQAHMRKHDGMQRNLQDAPEFANMLTALRSAAHTLTGSQVSAAMVGLGDIHEDLAFIFPSKPKQSQKLIMEVIDSLVSRHVKLLSPSAKHKVCDQTIANMLFSLSNLNMYVEDVFRAGSSELARRLMRSPEEFHFKHMSQWIFAALNVDYNSSDFEVNAIKQFPKTQWAVQDDLRLVAFCAALVCLRSPDPLLSHVLEEINERPRDILSKLSAGILYSLHQVRILTECEPRLSQGRLSQSLAKRLQTLVVSKCSSSQSVSKFEAAFQKTLRQLGVAFQSSPLVKYNLRADYRCTFRGHRLLLEVDGPSHFLVRPMERRRCKTVLKGRMFAAIGEQLVSVPYWVLSPPEKYVPEKASGKISSYSIDAAALERLMLQQLAGHKST
mmetsp:Transcript_89115/g.288174  ORF Transcript_89115/g.288174 Transcript_89115/m.288174 type:complete len:471 (+) Transcript_89115:54-1466(+)